MSKGLLKKLVKARNVASGAGFLLMQLEHRYGHDFSEGMRIQVKQAINECRQQANALAITEANQVSKETL